MKLFDLGGKVAIVTGGNGGIGLGMARGLAQAGAAVVVAGRQAAKNAGAVKELEGLGARAVAAEVRRVLREGSAAPGHVFNLGHGVLPETDPDVLTRVVALVHEAAPGARP